MRDKMRKIIVKVKSGWDWDGRKGIMLGTLHYICKGLSWTPVLWYGEDDPEFYKTHGLDFYVGGKKVPDHLLTHLEIVKKYWNGDSKAPVPPKAMRRRSTVKGD
jgi:hypothetical protein